MRFFSLSLGVCFLFFPCFAKKVFPTSPKRVVQVVSPSKRPTKSAPGVRSRPHQVHSLVILDAGHGGKDRGAKVDSVLEKRLCLTTTLLLKRALENLGYRVVLTRSRDVTLSLPRRMTIANKMEGTIFVSMHYNSAPNPKANGVEVFYCPSKTDAMCSKESKHLANCVLYQIVDQTSMHSRGVKTGNLYVNREADMPSILVEGGFMTNPSELSKLKNREFLMKLANGIARGVDKYLKS